MSTTKESDFLKVSNNIFGYVEKYEHQSKNEIKLGITKSITKKGTYLK